MKGEILMTNNLKFMLLGIFLAVFSVGGFALATEEEIFVFVGLILTAAAIWAFVKGFRGEKVDTKKEAVAISAQPVLSEKQND